MKINPTTIIRNPNELRPSPSKTVKTCTHVFSSFSRAIISAFRAALKLRRDTALLRPAKIVIIFLFWNFEFFFFFAFNLLLKNSISRTVRGARLSRDRTLQSQKRNFKLRKLIDPCTNVFLIDRGVRECLHYLERRRRAGWRQSLVWYGICFIVDVYRWFRCWGIFVRRTILETYMQGAGVVKRRVVMDRNDWFVWIRDGL